MHGRVTSRRATYMQRRGVPKPLTDFKESLSVPYKYHKHSTDRAMVDVASVGAKDIDQQSVHAGRAARSLRHRPKGGSSPGTRQNRAADAGPTEYCVHFGVCPASA